MSVTAVSWVRKRSESVGNDRMVLWLIADDANSDGVSAFTTVASIAEGSLLSERTVRRCIVALEALGELRVELNAGGTEEFRRKHPDRVPNLYTILLADRPEREPGTRPAARQRITSRARLEELIQGGVSNCHPGAETANPTSVTPEPPERAPVENLAGDEVGVSDCHPAVIHRGDTDDTPQLSTGVTAETDRGDSRRATGVTELCPDRGDRAVSPISRSTQETEQRVVSAPPAGDTPTGQQQQSARAGFFEQLVTVFGPASTKSRSAFYGRVITELIDLEPQPSCTEVLTRARRCIARYPQAGPGALAKYWDTLAGDAAAGSWSTRGWPIVDVTSSDDWVCAVGNPDCVNGLITVDATDLLTGSATRCACIGGGA